jgi:UDPglucose 6-dehydrogenase/GDP-mannose 6-dehydrogenase
LPRALRLDASNAVLATMISFSNEIARLCTAIGQVDAMDVMRGVHQSGYFTVRHERRRLAAPICGFLQPGCGFGGSCLPKDVSALAGLGRQKGLPMGLLESVLAINRSQPDEIVRLIRRHFHTLRDVPVTLLGIAFRPDTDDTRESPAFPLIRRLREQGALLTAYDPVARPRDHPELEGVKLADSLRDAVAAARIVVLVTRWDEFAGLSRMLAQLEAQPLVVDGRRMLEPREFALYEGIGRA